VGECHEPEHKTRVGAECAIVLAKVAGDGGPHSVHLANASPNFCEQPGVRPCGWTVWRFNFPWIEKHERGAYDDDAVEADLLDFPPSEPDSLGTCTARSGRDRLRRASRSRIARLIHRQVNETVRLTVGPPRCETLVVIDTLPL